MAAILWNLNLDITNSSVVQVPGPCRRLGRTRQEIGIGGTCFNLFRQTRMRMATYTKIR